MYQILCFIDALLIIAILIYLSVNSHESENYTVDISGGFPMSCGDCQLAQIIVDNPKDVYLATKQDGCGFGCMTNE
jgi:hypothetical protein